MDQAKLDFWFTYFAHSNSTAGALVDGAYVPIFQRNHPATAPRLNREPNRLYPDLSEVDTGICLSSEGTLALQFTAAHPFATGFAVDNVPCGAVWPVDSTPGRHEITVQAITRYGPLRPHRVSYQVLDG